MTVAFLGLGNLGRAIACRLIDRGVALTVWNRTHGKAEGLDVDVAESATEAAFAADNAVILCLTDSDAVAAVFARPGFLDACKGKVILDVTTNHPDRVLDFHRQATEAGAAYVECPVAGSVIPALTGSLVVLCSGEESAVSRVRPLLDHLGTTIHYLPEPGHATRMKLVNNLALGTIMTTLAEAVELGEAAGLPRDTVVDILGAAGGESLVMRAKAAKLKGRDWSPHFSVAMVRKDLRYLLELAASLGREARTGEASAELYDRAIAAGLGDDDFSAVADVASRPIED